MGDSALLILTLLSLIGPLVLAAMGGLTSERAGVMNIALEGFMLTSCCVTALVAQASGSALFGLLAGIGSASVLSLLHGLLTQAYRIDHIVSGMALNVLAIGGTNFLNEKFSDRAAASEIPSFGEPVYVSLAFLVPVLLAVYVRRTRGGLRLWAVGNDPDKARQMGVNPVTVRYVALLATGVFCGLAGAMIVSNTGRFVDNMTAGRGFIALAALILGGWRPLPSLVACSAFGLFYGLNLFFQGTPILGVDFPSEFWLAMPYLVTVVALALAAGRSRSPSGLGKP